MWLAPNHCMGSTAVTGATADHPEENFAAVTTTVEKEFDLHLVDKNSINYFYLWNIIAIHALQENHICISKYE